MTDILILYATREGQTRKIACRLNMLLKQQGFSTRLLDLAEVGKGWRPDDFEAIIVGASIHYGRYPSSVYLFLRRFQQDLRDHPGFFFSVSLTARRTDPRHQTAARQFVDSLVQKTGWRPVENVHLAGALTYSRYPLWKRLMLRFISAVSGGDTDTSRDYEYTDWVEVERFARSVARRLRR